MRLTQTLGVSRLASSAATLLVMFSPVASLSATLPGPSAAAFLGSAILFQRLLAPTSESDRTGNARGILGVWFLVCLLNLSSVLLLPAVLWRLMAADDSPAGAAPAARKKAMLGAAVALVGIVGLLALAALLSPASSRGLGRAARSAVECGLGRSSQGTLGSLTWLVVLAPALGVALLGLLELLRRPASAGESRPPAWLWAFTIVPISVQLLFGRPSLETAGWALGPALALGLASWCTRTLDRDNLRPILVLIGCQMALTVGFRVAAVLSDPQRDWSQRASNRLQPGDLVMTRDQQHDYLLRHRFKLQTINLDAARGLVEPESLDWWDAARQRVRSQQSAGGRVVVDWKASNPLGGGRGFGFSRELHELLLMAPVEYLGDRSPLGGGIETLPESQAPEQP